MFEPDRINFSAEINNQPVSVEEVLLDKDSKNFHSPLETSFAVSKFVKWFSLGVLLVFGVSILRLMSLQLQNGEAYLLAAEGNRTRISPQFAPRGLIRDRYGEIIARNIPNFELVAVPPDLPEGETDRQELINRISEIIGLKPLDVVSALAAAPKQLIEPVVIKQSVSQEEALRLEEVVAQTPGFKIQSVPIREYISGPAFAHILGYVGKLSETEWESKKDNGYYFNDFIGKTGVEQVYEEVLRGHHGQVEVEVDASGKIVKKLREILPKNGEDLQLTVDADLQNLLFRALENVLGKRPASTGASGMVLNVKTGEILALVSLPSFDNNLFAKGISSDDLHNLLNDKRKPMLNRTIGGSYPPGSVIKPIVAVAALEEEVINDKTKINDQGFIKVGDTTFYGWKRDGFGSIDIYTAIAQSSDPFFYVLGGGHEDYHIKGLGVSRLVEYFRRFNLGKVTGLPLPGEESGFVPTPDWKKQYFSGTDEERWYLGNTYHIAIGQGYLLTTPAQVAVYTAGIANDGVLMKPYLELGQEPVVLTNVGVTQKNLEIVKKAMRENVVSGSGVSLKDLPVEVAGKTGTAQFDPKDPERTHAWYTGYAPYDSPEIAVMIMIESGGEGHQAAIPPVKEILKWWSENRKTQ